MSDRLSDLSLEIRNFVSERDWERFHDPKNLAMALASEVGELLAEYRWVSNATSDQHLDAPDARRRVTEEIGDIGILLLAFCNRADIDLGAAIRSKLAKNAEKYRAEEFRGRAE